MKEILVSQPEYMQSFRCIGSACEDHCCKQWNIKLDKNTYKQYLKSAIPDVRNIAIEDIAVIKKSHDNWAIMKLNAQDNCSYLESNNLCKIHRTMGAGALSKTCSEYPRQSMLYKKERIDSLNLSCPEAVRQVLFNETALNIDSKVITQTHFNNLPDLNVEGKIINLFCANLLMVDQSRVEQNLYAIACFLLFAEKLTGSLDSKFTSMENFYSALIKQMLNDEMVKSLANIKTEPLLELALFAGIQGAIEIKPNTRGRSKLLEYTQILNRHFMGGGTEDNLSCSLKILKQHWEKSALPWLNERPYILRNYFQYRLYHDRFAIDQSVPILKQFYLLVVDYFYIKSLLSAHALDNGQIDEKTLVEVMYSYHSYRQHSDTTKAEFMAGIDSVKRNDDLSVLQLLV